MWALVDLAWFYRPHTQIFIYHGLDMAERERERERNERRIKPCGELFLRQAHRNKRKVNQWNQKCLQGAPSRYACVCTHVACDSTFNVSTSVGRKLSYVCRYLPLLVHGWMRVRANSPNDFTMYTLLRSLAVVAIPKPKSDCKREWDSCAETDDIATTHRLRTRTTYHNI